MSLDDTLRAMADDLVRVPGVRAVALGGSRARGTHHAHSDADLGLYHDGHALDLPALSDLAARWHGEPVAVAGPGGWGPWVDGGAWLVVDDVHVDWILREVGRVEQQADRAVRGEFAFHDQPGHPLGFLDVSYAGEVAFCRPLADPEGVLERLRARLTPYPEPLRRALVDNTWRASFLLDAARKGLPKGDTAYVALCLAQAAMTCAHAWHAQAGSWPTNEKGLVPAVAALPLATGGFADQTAGVLALVGVDDAAAVDAMAGVVAATRTRLGVSDRLAPPPDSTPSTAGGC